MLDGVLCAYVVAVFCTFVFSLRYVSGRVVGGVCSLVCVHCALYVCLYLEDCGHVMYIYIIMVLYVCLVCGRMHFRAVMEVVAKLEWIVRQSVK